MTITPEQLEERLRQAGDWTHKDNLYHQAADALKQSTAEVERLREALDRYRYAIEWVSADSWDHCGECRDRLAWARTMDGERLTADEMATIGHQFLGLPAPSKTARAALEEPHG